VLAADDWDVHNVMWRRERQNLSKINRRLDKKLRECQMLNEDERRNAEQYKDQVSDQQHLLSFVNWPFSGISPSWAGPQTENLFG